MSDQMTFGDIVGMESVVPPATLPDDDIVCEDGIICKHCDAWYDCKGKAWSNEDMRNDRDAEIVTDLLMDLDKWVTEYTTENDDYADGYECCVSETSHEWPEYIEEWLDNDDIDYSEYKDKLVEYICYELKDWGDWDWHYMSNEYARWTGGGVCLFSVGIGEHEEQVEVMNYPELAALHKQGRLDDVLDNVNCDVYVSRHCRRVKNEETGYYEDVGRKTYMPYTRDAEHPDLLCYHSPGGAWHAVVDDERIEELVEAFFEVDED